MNENLFDYNPITSWTGEIIDFGTGSSSLNYDITAICTEVNDVSTAIFRVDAYSDYDVNTAKYINETILKFFRGEIDESYISEGIIEIETHIIESFLDVIMSLTLDSIYEIDIKGILSTPGSLADYGIFNKHIEEPRSMSLAVGTINNAADPLTHGMPYMTLAWSDGALDPRCEDPAYTDQISCEASIISASCVGTNGLEVLADQYDHSHSPAFSTQSACENFANYQGRGCYYSSNKTNWYWSAVNNNNPDITEEECHVYSNNSYYYVLHETGNVYETINNSWWPSTYTSTLVTGQPIYEGEGIYFLPKIFEIASSTASSLTMNYDTFDLRGQSKIGRQSRVFYIGYEVNVNTVSYQTQINPDNYLHANLPAHLEVNTNSSTPLSQSGFTNLYDRTKIRWRNPEYYLGLNNRDYAVPDRYRIYRSNYYYYGQTSPTEYTMGIKRLVSSVNNSELFSNYLYFEESELALRAEGVDAFQYCYYYITAVWDDWGNTNRGLDKITYDGYFDDDFNFPPGNVLSTETDVLEINFPQQNDNQEEWTDEYFGYFKPQETGDYEFSMTSDDSSWMWIGTDGQTYEDLKLTRDDQNALIDLNGVHPSQTVNGTISLIKDQYYPILIYFGNKQFNQDENWEHRVSFKPPGGEFQTAGVGYWYKSNDNSFGGNGQEVEGIFSGEARSYFR